VAMEIVHCQPYLSEVRMSHCIALWFIDKWREKQDKWQSTQEGSRDSQRAVHGTRTCLKGVMGNGNGRGGQMILKLGLYFPAAMKGVKQEGRSKRGDVGGEIRRRVHEPRSIIQDRVRGNKIQRDSDLAAGGVNTGKRTLAVNELSL